MSSCVFESQSVVHEEARLSSGFRVREKIQLAGQHADSHQAPERWNAEQGTLERGTRNMEQGTRNISESVVFQLRFIDIAFGIQNGVGYRFHPFGRYFCENFAEVYPFTILPFEAIVITIGYVGVFFFRLSRF